MSTLLGLSFGHHDSAAALLVDGRVVSAIQEERLSRMKHDSRFPHHAIRHVLAVSGIRPQELDAVYYYEDPFRKFERIARTHLFRDRAGLAAVVREWVARGKFEILGRIASELRIDRSRVFHCRHHESHAASAYFSSPFDRATVVVIDGVGEHETASAWMGDGTSLRMFAHLRFPHSIGLLYSAFTSFLGFEVNDGEYKVMGLAGYGVPCRTGDVLKTLLSRKPLRLSSRYFSSILRGGMFYTPAFLELFGSPRALNASIADDELENGSGAAIEADRRYADIAASIQLVTEELVAGFVCDAVARTGVQNVAIAGGVALNALANARLVNEHGLHLYVHPAPGDAGAALGAALWGHCVHRGGRRPKALNHCFLGGAYSAEEIETALRDGGFWQWTRYASMGSLFDETASLLAAGKVVGWFQGRSEWGPRALGARSILCRPYPAEMRDRVNAQIKFREIFRPFAPAVLAERAHEVFEMKPAERLTQPESFMLSIVRVRDEFRSIIPAVTHVDGTARVQLVWPHPETHFRSLLERFSARTGIPVLLNTSFNLRGEPIVETPADALQTFSWSGLDVLAIGEFLVFKCDLP